MGSKYLIACFFLLLTLSLEARQPEKREETGQVSFDIYYGKPYYYAPCYYYYPNAPYAYHYYYYPYIRRFCPDL